MSAVVTQPWWCRFLTWRWLLASVLLHALLLGAAARWLVGTDFHPVPASPAFQPGPSATSRVSRHALEHRVKLARHRGGAPPAARRVVTLGPSRVALPAFPAVAPLPLLRPALLASGRSLAALGTTGTGTGPGSGGGDGADDAGQQLANLFTHIHLTTPNVGVALEALNNPGHPTNPEWLALRAYLHLAVGPHRMEEFDTARLFIYKATPEFPDPFYTLGAALLNLLNSGQKFDAIYVVAGFDSTSRAVRDAEFRYMDGSKSMDAWPLIQDGIRKQKIKLYLHVIDVDQKRAHGTFLEEIIGFARSTGGTVKFGPWPLPGEEVSLPISATSP